MVIRKNASHTLFYWLKFFENKKSPLKNIKEFEYG